MVGGRSTDRRGTGPRRMPINEGVANPLNPRDDDDPELEQLMATLRCVGQLQPVMVVTKERYLQAHPDQADAVGRAKWVVLGGNRRLMAARKANFRRIDVHEVQYNTADEFNQAILIENAQRKNLSPIHEAEAIQALMKPPGRTVRSVGAMIGKSHTYVQQRLDLLKLIPEFREMLNSDLLNIKAARSIAIKPEEVQRQLLAEQRDRGVRQRSSPEDHRNHQQQRETDTLREMLRSALEEL